jgi:hypothetical protein
MKFIIPTVIILALGIAFAWSLFAGQAMIAKESVATPTAAIGKIPTSSTENTTTQATIHPATTSTANTGIVLPGSGSKAPSGTPHIIGPSSNPPNY